MHSLVSDLCPHVAYGSAGPTMKTHGRGEVAVPTTGMYDACRRVFGLGRTCLVDEFNTTKTCWSCGHVKQKTYKTFTGLEETETLCHTSAVYMPKVLAIDVEKMERV